MVREPNKGEKQPLILGTKELKKQDHLHDHDHLHGSAIPDLLYQ